MTPEERSKRLQKEADKVLAMVHLRQHCAHIGKIVPTGSYFLNCMMYPDIDLYIPLVPVEILFGIAIKIARYDCVKKINFEKGGSGDLMKGLYLKPVIQYGEWERLWKIDIWSLPINIINEKQKELEDIKTRMTSEQKEIILNYKFSILTETGRTPMFSGIYIYRAVVNLGLKDFTKITEYLRKNEINI
jgi:hypothetical protein